MPLDKQRLLDRLRGLAFPGYSRDVVSLGVVRDLAIDGTVVEVVVDGAELAPAAREQLERGIRATLSAVDGVDEVRVRDVKSAGSPALKVVGSRPPRGVAAGGGVDRGLIPDVRRVIAVASGKGGVGKSTVAVNLAVALAAEGLRVGLLDADIYGPSIPLMFGLAGERPSFDDESRRLLPFDRCGVRLMSLGFLIEDADTAVIWRGPMVMKALEQLLGEVAWGALDVLVVDMPPGTGDAQLTMSQRVQLAGAVIVTTPQDVALADAIKGINMFRKVGVPLLGLVENMSYFRCPHCGERSEIFSHGGGRVQAERLDVPFLGEVPLDATLRASGDDGRPVVDAAPASALAGVFRAIARDVARSLALGPPDGEPATDAAGVFDRFRRLWKDPGSA
ncbi:MAG TPA: Mrp/NBP35 family ATP-binding protein [Candidatus Polarisedimenticolaceae bacterium]|nr:Mrp/NBP35 family ATP-binding protein [Candidatus Polarisedimenticolaceae bacterium]